MRRQQAYYSATQFILAERGYRPIWQVHQTDSSTNLEDTIFKRHRVIGSLCFWAQRNNEPGYLGLGDC